jgi:hypothetical protein
MESAANREKVYRALQDALRQDKSRTNILKISELGLVEMTRKRTRENLVQMLCEPCGYCEGRGYVLSNESVAFKVLREIRKDLPRMSGRKIAVAVNPRVAEVLLGPARRAHAELAADLGREIEIRARPGLHQEQFEVVALDEGPPVALSLQWLQDRKPEAEAPAGPEASEVGSETAAAEAAGELAVAAEACAPVPEGETAEAAPIEREAEPAAPWEPSPALAQTSSPEGDDALGTIARAAAAPPVPPVPAAEEKPAAAGEGIAAIAAPHAEMLDVEAESPILPASDESEES